MCSVFVVLSTRLAIRNVNLTVRILTVIPRVVNRASLFLLQTFKTKYGLELHPCVETKFVTGFDLVIALKVQSSFKKPLFELQGSSSNYQHDVIELPWEEVIALGEKFQYPRVHVSLICLNKKNQVKTFSRSTTGLFIKFWIDIFVI